MSIFGDHFTNWSRIYVNDEKISTRFVSDTQLILSAENAADLESGDTIKVCQVGSSNTIFRTTENALMYYAADAAAENTVAEEFDAETKTDADTEEKDQPKKTSKSKNTQKKNKR